MTGNVARNTAGTMFSAITISGGGGHRDTSGCEPSTDEFRVCCGSVGKLDLSKMDRCTGVECELIITQDIILALII